MHQEQSHDTKIYVVQQYICAYVHGVAMIFTISGRKIQFSIQQTLT